MSATFNARIELDFNKFVSDLKNVENKADIIIKDIEKPIHLSSPNTSKFEGGLNKLKGLIGASLGVAALVSFGKEVIETGNKMETMTARIRTLGGESKRLANDFKDLSIKMSKDIPISATEMQGALYDALSAGIQPSVEGMEKFMTAAGKLAVGGMESVGNTVNLLSSLLNAYGESADQASKYSDILFQTVNLGKTTIPELNASLSQVIPTASAAGIEIESIGASLALMTANGIPTAQATTKLNALLVALQKGSKDLDPLLKKASVSLDSLKNEPLVNNLEKLKKAFDDSGVASTQVFESIEASAAFNTLTKDIGKSKEFLDAMSKSAGATEAAFQDMASTPEMAMQKLKAQIEVVSLSLFQSLAPALNKVLTFAQNLITYTIEHSDAVLAVIIGISTAIIIHFMPAMIDAAAAAWAALAPIAPFVLAAAGLTLGLFALAGGFKQSAESKKRDADASIEVNKKQQDIIKGNIKEEETQNELLNSIKKMITEKGKAVIKTKEYQDKLEQLKKVYPDIISNTSEFGVNIDKLNTAVTSNNQAISNYNGKLNDLQISYKKLRDISIQSEFEISSEKLGLSFTEKLISTNATIIKYEKLKDDILKMFYSAKDKSSLENAFNNALKLVDGDADRMKAVQGMYEARLKWFTGTNENIVSGGGGETHVEGEDAGGGDIWHWDGGKWIKKKIKTGGGGGGTGTPTKQITIPEITLSDSVITPFGKIEELSNKINTINYDPVTEEIENFAKRSKENLEDFKTVLDNLPMSFGIVADTFGASISAMISGMDDFTISSADWAKAITGAFGALSDSFVSLIKGSEDSGRALIKMLLDTLQAVGNIMIVQYMMGNLGTSPASWMSFGLSAEASAAIWAGIFNTLMAGLRAAIGYKEGIIDLQGAGTETSDSIMARLSKHETVMPAWWTNISENKDFATWSLANKGMSITDYVANMDMFGKRKENSDLRNSKSKTTNMLIAHKHNFTPFKFENGALISYHKKTMEDEIKTW